MLAWKKWESESPVCKRHHHWQQLSLPSNCFITFFSCSHWTFALSFTFSRLKNHQIPKPTASGLPSSKWITQCLSWQTQTALNCRVSLRIIKELTTSHHLLFFAQLFFSLALAQCFCLLQKPLLSIEFEATEWKTIYRQIICLTFACANCTSSVVFLLHRYFFYFNCFFFVFCLDYWSFPSDICCKLRWQLLLLLTTNRQYRLRVQLNSRPHLHYKPASLVTGVCIRQTVHLTSYHILI